jgi:tetratricopeptide (TPR) repeat protein
VLEYTGLPAEAVTAYRRADGYAGTKRVVAVQEMARATLAWFELGSGQFERLDARESEIASSRSIPAWAARATRYALAGELERAIEVLPPSAMAGGVTYSVSLVHLARARVLSWAGEDARAREEFANVVTAVDASGALDPESPESAIAFMWVAGIADTLELADQATVARIYRVLTTGTSGKVALLVMYDPRGISAVRGTLALRLDLVDEAAAHFEAGEVLATRGGLLLQRGACLEGLAEVAERRGDHALAMERLDTAGELFAGAGAKIYLDQVLAKKEILRA